MLFTFLTPVLIRHLRQLKKVVFLHWCLIRTILLQYLFSGAIYNPLQLEKMCFSIFYFSQNKQASSQPKQCGCHQQQRNVDKVPSNFGATTLPGMELFQPTLFPHKSQPSSWGQCYKTFYVRNLRMFVISQSACPFHLSPFTFHLYSLV